ncbi:uncharacterized protein LOC112167869 isoform X2 [Rosa chinensis]|uniref:uncharacterized protein LOC112166659 isoform X2 n=1 Tax=Rosa chinensis TaxID=74649 RepID=UPI001AD91C69|nr:uncharacterized protein LOC112166659 isoform X2 [Rosa chinensis]XP_040362717.1 uncharacterized protein LOC112167869 isoform X2 [Rosa chinensis]
MPICKGYLILPRRLRPAKKAHCILKTEFQIIEIGRNKANPCKYWLPEGRSRLRAAPTALSKRHADGSLPIEDFNIVLENQSGKKVQMGSETDQQYDLIRVQAIMMSLMLHTNAKQLIKAQNYKDAMEVLSMEEEAFSLRSIGY